MAVDLYIPKISLVACRFKLTEGTKEILDQFLTAAREANPGADDDQIIEALLLNHFGKDKAFKKWLKAQDKPKLQAEPKPVIPGEEEGQTTEKPVRAIGS